MDNTNRELRLYLADPSADTTDLDFEVADGPDLVDARPDPGDPMRMLVRQFGSEVEYPMPQPDFSARYTAAKVIPEPSADLLAEALAYLAWFVPMQGLVGGGTLTVYGCSGGCGGESDQVPHHLAAIIRAAGRAARGLA
jgi:hypothetical protein